jgi:hemolysin activation/secretion protein
MIFLLAQLVAPPVQLGPVRLPGPGTGEQRSAPSTAPTGQPPVLETEPAPARETPAPGGPAAAPAAAAPLPRIEGSVPLGQAEITRLLAPCLAISDPVQRLNACAASLAASLVNLGYVNTRVYINPSPAPGSLQVVEGRLVEVRVNGGDEALNRRVRRLLRPLQGEVLHLPRVERQLQLLRVQPGVASVRGNLSRLGSDASQAVLVVTLSPGAQPWQGDLSVRNDGSSGSGQFRAVTALARSSLATRGDNLLLYTELNTSSAPEFGAMISSLSYTLPLRDQLSFTTALGYSRRNLIDLPAPANGFSTSQYQALGQLEWVFRESLTQRWSLSLAYSANRSNTYLADQPLPATTPQLISQPSSGFLRLSLSGSGISPRLAWSGNAYLLQGISASIPVLQRQELAQVGINPGQARAVGGLISTAWSPAPGWQLNLRAAGQWAFQPLLSSMQFSLGSDVGLRGLPGQLISGNSGLLGTVETVWTFWEKPNQALQLVPFLGAGRVSSTIQGLRSSDSLGSGGLLLRWLGGSNWLVELGWVKQFFTANNPGPWNNSWLGNGLHAKMGYRF